MSRSKKWRLIPGYMCPRTVSAAKHTRQTGTGAPPIAPKHTIYTMYTIQPFLRYPSVRTPTRPTRRSAV